MKLLKNENSLYITVIIILLFYVGFEWSYDNSPFLNYRTNLDLDGGDYVRFIYIGSSRCGFANDEENHQNILNLKKALKEFVETNNYLFITTGISVDINAYQGFKYLEKTGPFDEILSGSSWFNSGANRYVWERFQGNPSTPQIILTRTKFKVEEYFGIFQSEEIIKRVSGKDEIREMLATINNLSDSDIAVWLNL
ncbi:MAG: hypothetical protein ACFCU6_00115 [Balneolaceae bacterium]